MHFAVRLQQQQQQQQINNNRSTNQPTDPINQSTHGPQNPPCSSMALHARRSSPLPREGLNGVSLRMISWTRAAILAASPGRLLAKSKCSPGSAPDRVKFGGWDGIAYRTHPIVILGIMRGEICNGTATPYLRCNVFS